MFGNSLRNYMILIPAVLIALMFHELAHGLVAYWLGDDTAKRAGRLTLNPLDHLDPLGTLCMIFFGFGWAKPVPVNTSRFRHRKVGMALTALAGPLANFLLSFVLIFIALLMQTLSPGNQILLALSRFFIQTGQLSVCLGVFNLIPIPPLDGSRVLQVLLPNKIYYKLYRYEAYFQIGLIVLLFLGAFNNLLYTLQVDMLSLIVEGAARVLSVLGLL